METDTISSFNIETCTVREHRFTIHINQGVPWQRCINEFAPCTNQGDDVYAIGSSFPIRSHEIESVPIVLVHSSDFMTNNHIMKWAESKGLVGGNPREAFHAAEHVLQKKLIHKRSYSINPTDFVRKDGFCRTVSISITSKKPAASSTRTDFLYNENSFFVLREPS